MKEFKPVVTERKTSLYLLKKIKSKNTPWNNWTIRNLNQNRSRISFK